MISVTPESIFYFAFFVAFFRRLIVSSLPSFSKDSISGGVTVDGKSPKEVIKDIDEGRIKVE